MTIATGQEALASDIISGLASTFNWKKPNTVVASSAASPLVNTDSITTAFTGDLSHCQVPFSQMITGAATLGQPASGYRVNPELSVQYTYLYSSSGWNNGTANSDGRTAASAYFTVVQNFGQGDCIGYLTYGLVANTNPNATYWLANPSASAYAAQIGAGTNHVYLNPVEVDTVDNGFDCAAISFVGNLERTNATAALGEPWIWGRGQSTGTAFVDAFLSASGKFTYGMDLTTAQLGTADRGAIVLADSQRIFLGASNTTGFPRGTSVFGSPYITSVSGIASIVNGANQLEVAAAQVTTLLDMGIGGNLFPTTDNASSSGASGKRWSSIWAVNGTIQTSDPQFKTNISSLPSTLGIVHNLSPITFKWKVGGLDSNGKERPGKRTHWGFLAPDIKKTFEDIGIDFAGYVKAEDGTEALRPDQLIPVLWKAVQELSSEISALKERVAKFGEPVV